MTVPARQNLYRKYRPQKFSELAGQEHISKTIQSAIATGRISHAYMFSGPRGTGKTSSARLLAKILNCKDIQKDKNGLPDCCGVCDNCRRIEEMNFMDIVEIDAASNNGVEDIRQMREKVKYKPVEGKYKIYIIDEVHMLSGSAFNAFLKTLEEPPENVIFVLATTDPQKVPATIISRCQCFDFHSVSRKTIQTRLEEIVSLEHKEGQFPEFEPEALSMIAECAEGGFRDALSILDQISSSSISDKITLDQVLEMTRRLSYSTLKLVADAVFNHDLAGLVKVLNELYVKGYEPLTIGRDLLEYMRRCMLLKIDPNANQILDLPVEQVNETSEQIKSIGVRYLIGSVTRVERILMTLRSSLQARILLESELIKLALGDEIFASEALERRIEELEQKIAGLKRISVANQQVGRVGLATSVPSVSRIDSPKTVVTPIRKNTPSPTKNIGPNETLTTSVKSINSDLTKFISEVGKTSNVVSAFLQSANLRFENEKKLIITVGYSFAYSKLKEEKHEKILLEAAKSIWKNIEQIKLVDSSLSNDSNLNQTLNKPVDMVEEIAKIDEQAKQRVKQTSEVADAIKIFDADIIGIE